MRFRIHQIVALACLLCVCAPYGRSEDREAPAKKPSETKEGGAAVPAKPKSDKPKTPADAADVDVIAAPLVEALRDKLVIKPVARQAVVANAQRMQIQQQQAQLEQQLRPVLLLELGYIRQICDLPVDQRPKIKAAGEAVLKDLVQKMSTPQVQARVAGQGVLARGGDVSNPRSFIREGLAKALKTSLSEDQMLLYQHETESRVADRKRAANLVIVSRIDGALLLSSDQREKISEAISSNWQERWEQWLSNENYQPIYYPQIPDTLVTKHLTVPQKQAWATLQKVDFGISENGFMTENDGWWGDEPEAGKLEGPVDAIR